MYRPTVHSLVVRFVIISMGVVSTSSRRSLSMFNVPILIYKLLNDTLLGILGEGVGLAGEELEEVEEVSNEVIGEFRVPIEGGRWGVKESMVVDIGGKEVFDSGLDTGIENGCLCLGVAEYQRREGGGGNECGWYVGRCRGTSIEHIDDVRGDEERTGLVVGVVDVTAY